MENGFIVQSSLLVGIIPALIILYYSLKDWHGKFQEKTLFIMLIIGFFTGSVMILLEVGLFYNTIAFITIFPFLGQIIKTMILNLRRFHAKRETVIYGLALGLGFGSLYPAALIVLFDDITLFILISSLGIILLHGSTGAMIGYGIYRRNLLYLYFFSGGIFVIANILIKIEYFQLINLILGIMLFLYVNKKMISEVANENKDNKNIVKQ